MKTKILVTSFLSTFALTSFASTSMMEAFSDVPEPEEVRSSGGKLNVTLEAAPSVVTVGGKTFTSNVFNGSYIPYVLVVKRNDDLKIKYINNIDKADIEIDEPQPSNLHYHGMEISPKQPADNTYFMLESGKGPGSPMPHDPTEMPLSFQDGTGLISPNTYIYHWKVPAKHPLGPHWYHPHVHGMVESQVESGMAGMLVIDGMIPQHYPHLAGLKTRRFIFKDIDLPGTSEGDPKSKTINGTIGKVIRMRPGEIQIWEMGNLGGDAFFDISVDHHKFIALAYDSHILKHPLIKDDIFLPNGARSVVAMKAKGPGIYKLRSRKVDTGPIGDPNPEVVLATVIVEGGPLAASIDEEQLLTPAANVDIHPTEEELAAMPVTRKRTMVFSSDDNGFYINGKLFDPARDDVVVKLGDVEEWTILNVTKEKHVLHLHQLHYLVKSVTGPTRDVKGLRDTMDIPFKVGNRPGKLVVKVPFTNPLIVGRFPFHCHILEHEDGGMMANIRVRP